MAVSKKDELMNCSAHIILRVDLPRPKVMRDLDAVNRDIEAAGDNYGC